MKFLLALTLIFCLSMANVVNDDNYVLFSHDVKGSTSLPSKDGYLFLISHKISKVNLETRIPEVVKQITYLDGSPVYLD